MIPFGGAFVLLSFLDHLIHAIERWTRPPSPAAAEVAGLQHVHVPHAVHLTQPYLISIIGVIFLGLLHSPKFRGAVWEGLCGIGRFLRMALVEFPLWVADVTLLTRFLKSPLVDFIRKRLLTSLLLTALICRILPALGFYSPAPTNVMSLVFLSFAVLLNSRVGRDIEELAAERAQLMWHRIRVHVFVALFDLVMDSFNQVLEWLERVLYEVDEWLRFKSGETGLTLAVKAVLGLIWSILRFFIEFLVTVLIEPQINPIKHFPVVTVSHKIIFPMQFPIARSLVPVLGGGLAYTTAATTVLLLPGVFGFLVWELRGNWRLYAVNRHRDLKPAIVGGHGETLLRLMRLGLHSGTLPRLFARLRRAARRAQPAGRLRRLMGDYARLHHVEVDVRRFLERDFLGFLLESRSFADVAVEVGRTELGTNSLRVEIRAPELGEEPLWLSFEEESGRIVAGIWQVGWLRKLSAERQHVVAGLLVGFYRLAGVDVVREQIVECLGPAHARGKSQTPQWCCCRISIADRKSRTISTRVPSSSRGRPRTAIRLRSNLPSRPTGWCSVGRKLPGGIGWLPGPSRNQDSHFPSCRPPKASRGSPPRLIESRTLYVRISATNHGSTNEILNYAGLNRLRSARVTRTMGRIASSLIAQMRNRHLPIADHRGPSARRPVTKPNR